MVPFARSGFRQVDGEDERREARVLGLRDELGREAAIAGPVELKPARSLAADRFGKLARANAPQAGECVDGSDRGRSACKRRFAVRVGHTLEGRRSDHERHGDVCSEDRCARAHVADVDEHARPQDESAERRDVVLKRELVSCPADDIAPVPGLAAGLGEALEVGDGDRPQARSRGGS